MSLSDAEVAIAAALAGAEVVVRDYGATHARLVKSATDFATETDVNAETAIMKSLTSYRPQDRLTGEESGSRGLSSGTRRWLIDPLCGTLNFAATTPLLAVNVALLDDAGTAAAASIDPIAREVFWTDGSQAHLRVDGVDRSLAPSAVSGLVEINCDAHLIVRSSGENSSTTLACAPFTAPESFPPPWALPGPRQVEGRRTSLTERSTRTCTSLLE